MPSTLTLDGKTTDVEILARRPQLKLRVGHHVYTVEEFDEPDTGAVTLLINGHPLTVWRRQEGERIHLKVDDRTFSVNYLEAVVAAAQGSHSGNEIRAEMPGMVVDVLAAADGAVTAGAPLLVIESMKMQITIIAPRDGIVETFHVERNASFQKGAVLVSLRAVAE